MTHNNNIYTKMESDISKADLDDSLKSLLLSNISKLKREKINLMVTGATGCGKSSTINALFKTEVAKVGIGVDPETMDIKEYDLQNLTLWDTPGLGDGKEKDNQHGKAIIKKLNELDSNGKPLIDLVLVILDGSSRDLGTSYELINQVIIPSLGENPEDRILITINQADIAMKGRHWNSETNKPERELIDFLEKKVLSIKNRIYEATGVNVEPIYYSAGYKEEGEEQRPYNLIKLLYFIIQHTPKQKRLAFIDNTSDDGEMWEDNDELEDYQQEIQKNFMDTVTEYASKGADIGGDIGKVFGSAGEAIGRAAGAVVGAIGGAISSWFS